MISSKYARENIQMQKGRVNYLMQTRPNVLSYLISVVSLPSSSFRVHASHFEKLITVISPSFFRHLHFQLINFCNFD